MLASAKDRSAHSAAARALYFEASGEPCPVGAIIVNETLAKTFETIAEAGPDAFYTGALAQEIASTVTDDTPHAGAMTLADIAGYEAAEREPVCGSYRLSHLCDAPPTSGGVAVLQLGQLERFDLAEMGLRTCAPGICSSTQRLAYADRELYLADSDFVSVLPGLVDPEYLAGQRPDRRRCAACRGTTATPPARTGR